MPTIGGSTWWGLAALAVAAAFAAGDLRTGSSQRRAQDTRDLLQGTWLREYRDDGTQVRRVLTLEPDGGFREQTRVRDGTGRDSEFVNEGTWLFDGTNLKRKYTLVNGRPPSRLHLPFATFEIRFETRNEFVGIDHVHRNQVLYRRVGAGTQP